MTTITTDQLAERLGRIQAHPDLPEKHRAGISDWTGDGYETLREAAPEQLNKLIQSLVKTKLWALGDTNPQPVAENAPAAHSASPSPIQPTYLIGHGATDAKSTERIPFKELQNRVASPLAVSKLKADWIVTSGIVTREKGKSRGPVFTDLIPLDCDAMGGKTLAQFTQALSETIGGCNYEAHTTVSATPDKQKARGYVPLGCLIEDVETLHAVQRVFYQKLAEKGFPMDKLFDIERIMFLPNRNIDADGFYDSVSVRDGGQFNPLTEWADEIEVARKGSAPTTAPTNPGNTKASDPFANMPEPKLQAPDVLAALLKKLDPDYSREHWRIALSCIHLHLPRGGYEVARDWSAEGDKYMRELAPPYRKITSLKAAEAQFRKVWDEIAEDTGFRMGAGALFAIMLEQHKDTSGKRGMSSGDIAQWHKDTANQADPETKKTPPAGFTLTSYFSNHTLTNKDAEKMEHTKFIYPNLIPQGLITAYPSPPNGGKTAIFTHAACKMAAQGLEVFYINADASPSQLKSQQEKADTHGFRILAPDAKDAGGVNGLMGKLSELSHMDVSLSNFVLVVDTLKKFVDMLSKAELKNFINLLRKLVAKGATVCLLVHTNKYLAADGKLIYEGTADLRADIDNMIYLYSSLVEPGVREVTSDPDKTRTTFSPISFRIRFGDMGVAVEELDVVLPCFTDELREVFDAAKRAIEDGTRSQEALVQHVAEELMLGVNKARDKIKEVCDLKNSPLIRRRVQNAPGFTFGIQGENPMPYGEF